MQEAQRAGTFVLFCRGEMGGQGSPKMCVWGGGGRLDDLLPTRTDVTGREETGSKVRRPPHLCRSYPFIKEKCRALSY